MELRQHALLLLRNGRGCTSNRCCSIGRVPRTGRPAACASPPRDTPCASRLLHSLSPVLRHPQPRRCALQLPCSSSALGSVSSIRRHKPEPVPASPGAGPDPDTSSEAPKNSTAGAASELLSAHIDDLERKWEARRELQHQHLNKNSQPSANSAGNKTSTATTSTSTSIGKTRKFKNSYEAALFKRRSNKKKKKEKIQNTQKHASEEVGAQPPTVGLPVRSENPVDRFIANVILRRFDLAEEALLSVVNAGIPMSVGILNSKIEMLVYQGNLIAAFDVLEKEFEEHYLAPNGKSFEKLLVGCLTAIRYRRVPEKQRKHFFPTIPATEASQLTEELDRLAFVPSEAVINHPDRSEAYWTNRACLLLEKMIDSGFTPNLRIFDLFMRTFLLQGKYKRVFEMFKRMKDYDIKPDEIAYAIVLETLAVRQGDLDGAYQLLEEMNNSGIEMDLNIRTILINAHLHANDDEGAKRRFSELIEFRNHNVSSEKTQSLSDLIFAYGSLVNVFCRSGDMDEAQYIVRHEIPRVFGCTGNSVVYNNLMQGFCLNGDLTAAVAVFHEMRKLGIEPNITSYNILIGGHVRHENHQEALHWYQALIKNPVVKPNLVTYNIMINSHLKANDPASAEALHNRILEEGMLPDHGSIGPMVEYFSLKCDWPTVGRIIEHYREVSRVHGAKFHGKERGRVQYSEISAHNIVLHRMRKHGTVSAVLKHFLEVSNPDSSVPDAEDSDAEDSEDASETTYAPDFRTYDILIRSLGAMKETKSARRWFEDAMRRKVADIRLFNTMMAVYLDCGMPKDAVRVFRLIEEYGLKPDMLSVTLMFKATKGKKVETDEHGA